MEKSVGTEGKHLRPLEEGEVASLSQTGQSENYTDGLGHSPTVPQTGVCVHWCARWLGDGA